MAASSPALDELVRRTAPALGLADDAARVAEACHAMSLRFRHGGKLLAFGNGSAATDAQHIAVEFVHPVVIGKPALPAVALTNDAATLTGVADRAGFPDVFSHQVRALAEPMDIALGLSPDGRSESVQWGLEEAHDVGLLTLALCGADGGEMARSPAVDHAFVCRSDDPHVVKEVHVTTYHLLWELVHVFFERAPVHGADRGS